MPASPRTWPPELETQAEGYPARMDKKVAALLLSMAYRTGHFRDGGTIIPIRMTHELIAKIIYSDRVSVSRAVSELEKRGLIRLRNSEYCILDFVGLTDIVEE